MLTTRILIRKWCRRDCVNVSPGGLNTRPDGPDGVFTWIVVACAIVINIMVNRDSRLVCQISKSYRGARACMCVCVCVCVRVCVRTHLQDTRHKTQCTTQHNAQHTLHNTHHSTHNARRTTHKAQNKSATHNMHTSRTHTTCTRDGTAPTFTRVVGTRD